MTVRRALAAAVGLAWLAALTTAPVQAQAQPRRVAVVNAAADQAAGAALAAGLRRALVESDALEPVPPGPVAAALESPLDPDAAVADTRAQVRQHVEAARAAMARFDDEAAFRALASAERAALAMPPGTHAREMRRMLAELSILAAQIHAWELPRADARRAIERATRSARRLDPGRTLDAAVLRPEVVEAYRAAAAPQAQTGALVLSAVARDAQVFVDGELAGQPVSEGARGASAAPTDGGCAWGGADGDDGGGSSRVLDVAPGVHYVQVVRPGHGVAGARVDVPAGRRAEASVQPAPLADHELARAARARALVPGRAGGRVDGRDALCAAAAAAHLTGARSAAIITGERGALWVGLYDRATGRLSEWRSARGHMTAAATAALMRPLAMPLLDVATAVGAPGAQLRAGAFPGARSGLLGPPPDADWGRDTLWVPATAFAVAAAVVTGFLLGFEREVTAVTGTCCGG